MNRSSHLRPSSAGITPESFSSGFELLQKQYFQAFNKHLRRAERSLFCFLRRQAELREMPLVDESSEQIVNGHILPERGDARPVSQRAAALLNLLTSSEPMPGSIVKGNKAIKHQAIETTTAKELQLWRFSILDFLDPGGRQLLSSAS